MAGGHGVRARRVSCRSRSCRPWRTCNWSPTVAATAPPRSRRCSTLFPALKTFEARKAGLLSGGQRQQLSIARALITEPSLIILDEPTEGIQPNIVAEIEQLVMDLADTGLSVLLVEQHVSFALTAAAGYAVLASGHITSTGDGGTEAVGSVVAAMSI